MTEQQKIKNIIAFLAILFGESKVWHEEIMQFSPDYLIEKFERYILNTRSASDWGLHTLLRRNLLEPYFKKHNIKYEHYIEIGGEDELHN